MWYYARGREQVGPVSEEDLKSLLSAGQVRPSDLVWSDGMENWSEARGVPQFSAVAVAAQATQSAPPAALGYAEPAGAYAYHEQAPGGYLNYATPQFVYATFWQRFAAYFIDTVLLAVAQAVVSDFPSLLMRRTGNDDIASALFFMGRMIGWVGGWLYFAMMESSLRQATLGKMALGILVTDLDGRRLSFGRATGRYFAKWLSWMTFLIGFIMAAFTERRQGLHDLIAGTLVVKRA